MTFPFSQMTGPSLCLGSSVVLAEDLGDVTAVGVSGDGRWLALGLGLQV